MKESKDTNSKNGECHTYYISESEKERLRAKYNLIAKKQAKQTHTHSKRIDTSIAPEVFFKNTLESATTNTEKVRNIIEYLCYNMAEKDADGNKKYPTVESRVAYLNKLFYSKKKKDDKNEPQPIVFFFEDLFGFANNDQPIMKGMRFRAGMNKGTPIYRNKVEPLTWLSTVMGVPNNDFSVEDKNNRARKKDGITFMLFDTDEVTGEDLISNQITGAISDIAHHTINNNDELFNVIDCETIDEKLSARQDVLHNFMYLPDDLKQICRLLYMGYSQTQIWKMLDLTPSKLNTKMKHLRQQLKNPIVEVDSRKKKCCVCGQEKIITDFTKDTSRKGGYSPRCKQCDRARKNKSKVVGNIKKSA